MDTLNTIKLADFENNKFNGSINDIEFTVRSNCKTAFYFVIAYKDNKVISQFFVNNLKALRAKLLSLVGFEVEQDYTPIFFVALIAFVSLFSTKTASFVEAIKHFFDFETITYTGALIGFVPLIQALF